MVQEYDKFFTVAQDARIQVTFDPTFVDSYRFIGYENRALDDTELEKDTVDAGEIGASQTITSLYQLVRRGRASGSFGTWSSGIRSRTGSKQVSGTQPE